MKICEVCGASGASFHYSGLVCHSCRVFFVRSINRGTEIPCRNGEFQCEKEITDNMTPIGTQLISQLKIEDVRYFLNQMIHFEKLITNLEGYIPTGSVVDPNISLAELLTNPGRVAPRETAAWNTQLAKRAPGEYSLIHLYSRMCVCSAEFLCSIPEFHELPSLDMLKLAQHHIGHIGALDHMFYQWKFGVESANTLARTEDFTMSEQEKACWNKRCVSSAAYFQPAVEIFAELGITHEEVMLLKLILVFYTPENLSPEAEKICKRARAKYQNMLRHFVESEFAKMSDKDKVARIWRILDVFKRLKDVSEDAGQKYAVMILNNVGGMRKQLPFEIRVKKFI